MVYSKGEIRSWANDDVTLEFMDRLKLMADTLDDDTHSALLAGKEHMALAPNARMQQLKEVLMVVDEMLEEAEGE